MRDAQSTGINNEWEVIGAKLTNRMLLQKNTLLIIILCTQIIRSN